MRSARSRSLVCVAVALAIALTSSPALAGRATVTIKNQSSWAIREVYVSPSDERSWGPDQLGKKVLRPGHYFELSGIRCGDWDLKLVDEEGDECILTEVRLCGDESEWVLHDENLLACEGYAGGDEDGDSGAVFTLTNDTSYDLHEIYLSPAHERRWGEDHLGREILASGHYLELSGIECGTYDLKILDEDGDECVVTGIDLCNEESGWHLTDRALLSCEGWQ